MKGTINKVILTADYLDDAHPDYDDLNTDVIVRFENGDEYVATFYSYRSLEQMMEEIKSSKAFVSGRYYKILNMVVVRDFNGGDLLPVIDAMLAEGDFQLVFKKLK